MKSPLSPAPVDVGEVTAEGVRFAPWRAASEPEAEAPPAPQSPDERVGFAVVGLGRLSLEQLLPALMQTRRARLVALVSGSPDKLRAVAAQYGVAAADCYAYDDFDRLRANARVEAVYVVLPNALHREAVERAARAGKHVLCEKPMATSSEDARAMIAACRAAGRKLMIAYRSRFEPHVAEAIRVAREGELGALQLIDAINVEALGDPTQWRLRRALAGGGSLPDIGLYCLNVSRAVAGEEPEEVYARAVSPKGDARFREVEDRVAFQLGFPSGVMANCITGYNAHRLSRLTIMGSTGWVDVANAFDYEGARLRVARKEGGRESVTERVLAAKNQFAEEIDHFAECVREGKEPRSPGEEGLRDQVLMEALYESARERAPRSPGQRTMGSRA